MTRHLRLRCQHVLTSQTQSLGLVLIFFVKHLETIQSCPGCLAVPYAFRCTGFFSLFRVSLIPITALLGWAIGLIIVTVCWLCALLSFNLLSRSTFYYPPDMEQPVY